METIFEFYTPEHVNRLQTYIEHHFTLNSTARHLVRNILDYVAVQGEDDDITLELLTTLLDGIGITKEEIIHAMNNNEKEKL